jgi:hypothetical protein
VKSALTPSLAGSPCGSWIVLVTCAKKILLNASVGSFMMRWLRQSFVHAHIAGSEVKVLDYNKISDVVVGDAFTWDYPDFCDAFIESANYDGRPMSEEGTKYPERG